VNSVIESICTRNSLSTEEAEAVFGEVVRGEMSEALLAALLAALKTKGETPDEVAGAARAMLAHALPFDRPGYLFADCCGTGGDGQGTLNVSTAVAFVAAEAGLPVAKHGNRAVSSRAGSADVLEALGARIDVAPDAARKLLDEVGVSFLFAPKYHGGLRHAISVRRTLGMRTVMNLLGPLVNPARPAVQLTGVYDAALVVPVARTLGLLGCRTALVVHGGGLDEIALHAPTRAALYRDGKVELMDLTPADAGVSEAPLAALRGGSPRENAGLLACALAGCASEPHLAAIAINAGALLWIAGRSATLRDGTATALAVLASGRAHERLVRYIARSVELAEPASPQSARMDPFESEVSRGVA
jgi:anthranilate phosphoribosyltransferase